MQVHTSLGPGLLKNTYTECLYYRILQAGIMAEKEKPIPLIFEGVKLECGYRLDIFNIIRLKDGLKRIINGSL